MPLTHLLFSPEGRIPRSTLWFYFIVTFGILALASIIDMATGTYNDSSGLGLVSGLFMIISVFTNIMVLIKRCHDRNRSGWFILVTLIPIVQIALGIELLFLAGTHGDNKYGPDPIQRPGSDADELKKYANLRDQGIITDEEFQEKKKKLLNL